jgi:hypothetical protein
VLEEPVTDTSVPPPYVAKIYSCAPLFGCVLAGFAKFSWVTDNSFSAYYYPAPRGVKIEIYHQNSNIPVFIQDDVPDCGS